MPFTCVLQYACLIVINDASHDYYMLHVRGHNMDRHGVAGKAMHGSIWMAPDYRHVMCM